MGERRDVTGSRLALALVALLAGGCADGGLARFVYDLGDQYACTSAHADRLDERGAAVTCSDPAHPARSRYADYAATRAARGETP